MCWGIGPEIAGIFASGDENDFPDSQETGRSSSVCLALRLAVCHLRTKIEARMMVHAEAITARIMVAIIIWDWSGSRFSNDCLVCQVMGDGPWSRREGVLTTNVGAILGALGPTGGEAIYFSGGYG